MFAHKGSFRCFVAKILYFFSIYRKMYEKNDGSIDFFIKVLRGISR